MSGFVPKIVLLDVRVDNHQNLPGHHVGNGIIFTPKIRDSKTSTWSTKHQIPLPKPHPLIPQR